LNLASHGHRHRAIPVVKVTLYRREVRAKVILTAQEELCKIDHLFQPQIINAWLVNLLHHPYIRLWRVSKNFRQSSHHP
jgi:hypothetical protein